MDGLSGAASVIAVIDLSAKVATLCFQYYAAVKNAKEDIQRLQKKVDDVNDILKKIKELLNGHNNERLSATSRLSESSLQQYFLQLEEIKTQLEPGKSRKAMSRLGVRALKWPFSRKEVDRIVDSLENFELNFSLALQVDQTSITIGIDQKFDLARLQVAKGASFNSHIEEHNAKCLPSTRVELLTCIAEWVKDPDSKQMFWLNGMAGTGKSTIARTIADSLSRQGQLGASFFFKRGEGDCGSATRFFTTIAADLALRIPEIIPGIQKTINDDPNISERALKDQFEKLILEPFTQAGRVSSCAGKPVIIIDALDECEHHEDIRTILRLLTRTKYVRVFLTSRPEFSIRLGFKQMPDGTYQDLILHQVSEEVIEHDITQFLKYELAKIRNDRSLSADWPSNEQIRALVEMAIPLFIYAATVCRYIGDMRHNPKKRLDVVLQHQPGSQISKLDRTYLHILGQLFDDEDEDDADKERWANEFQEIVGSIIILKSPLSIASLSRLLNIPKEDIRCRLDLLHSVLSVPMDDHIPVRLLHLSFRDFLLGIQKSGRSRFWIDEKEIHKGLLTNCLRLLSATLKQNICNIQTPGSLMSQIPQSTIDTCLPSVVQYACRYWVHHLEQSQDWVSSYDQIHNFLHKSLLHWLEAMGLIGEVSTAIQMIDVLQTHFEERHNKTRFMYDAKRFALKYRFIIEHAPLQIYVSGVTFTPEQSILRTNFQAVIPKWIQGKFKVEKKWDAGVLTLEGHSSLVNTTAVSPNGRLVVSGSIDKTARIWNTTTGNCRSVLEHINPVFLVGFSPDGKLVISATQREIRVWDAITGDCKNEIKHDYSHEVAFSKADNLIAFDSGNKIILWDTITWNCRSELQGHMDTIHTITFSPDGKLVASSSDDKTVRLWEIMTSICKNKLQHNDSVKVVKFCPNSRRVASKCGNTVLIWDVETGNCERIIRNDGAIGNYSFSPDGKLIASDALNKTARIWEVASGNCKNTLQSTPGSEKLINVITFLSNDRLVTSGLDKTIRIWDVATGHCQCRLQGHSSLICDVSFSPDRKLIVSGSFDSTLRLWDVPSTDHDSEVLGHNGHTRPLILSPNGKLVVSGSLNTIWLSDIATGNIQDSLQSHGDVVQMVKFSPDSMLLALVFQTTIRVFDTTTCNCKAEFHGHSDVIRTIAFTSDGKLLASGSGDKTVRLWDTITGDLKGGLPGHTDIVRQVAFSPNGKTLASGSNDKTARLWDTITGDCKKELQGHSDAVKIVVFSSDNKLLMSTSDHEICLWDAITGDPKTTIKLDGRENGVMGVAFSPDSRLIASTSYDKKIRLWDVSMAQCLEIIDAASYPTSISFSADGSYLETNRGRIQISSTKLNISVSKSSLFVQDNWICNSQLEKLVWLPPEFRSSGIVVCENILVTTNSSGDIAFLRILNSDDDCNEELTDA